MNAEGYLRQLQALLPQGAAAWARSADARLTAVLTAIADEFSRLDARAEQLIDEADPRTTNELLQDWERVAGLPDPCVQVAQSVAERRAALVAKLTSRGGQSPSFYIELAARLGFEITITEFDPFVAGSSVGDPLSNDAWRYVWQVNAPEVTVREFAVNESHVGEPLRSWGNELLECVIERVKPAHTVVIFTYA